MPSIMGQGQSPRSSFESHEGPDKSLLEKVSIPNKEKFYGKHKTSGIWKPFFIIPWLLSFILFVLLIVERRSGQQCQFDGYWRTHELEGARRELSPSLKEVKFTGGLKIQKGVGLYRNVDPQQPAYVGQPTAEIDSAWSALIEPLNLFMTIDEAEVMGTEGMVLEPESGLYMAMPQGIHDLHCLNMLRQALYLEYYPAMNTSTLQVHLDHCIDSIRQSLMCSMDTTLIKEFWSDELNRMMADFDNVHICRDFQMIREWMNGRNAEDDVWPIAAERLWAASKSHR